MARRRYLVAYDIRDDKRLRTVATCMEGYGDRIHYSVFICDLSNEEAIGLRTDIETLIRPSEDSVMIIDLGRPEDTTRFLFIGQHEQLPTDEAVII
jgi:CRISPR-associated protein Cas2